jgi:hypothetical protein
MVKTFLSALKIVKNFGKIKIVVNNVYSAISKTLDALEFVLKQTNETKLGKTLQKNLPVVISVLSKVKQVFEKYGPLLGLELVFGLRLEEEDAIFTSLNSIEKTLDVILE